MPCRQCNNGEWECGPNQGDLCGFAEDESSWCCDVKQELDGGIWYLICSPQREGDCDCTIVARRWGDTSGNEQNIGMVNIPPGEDGVYQLCCQTVDGSCYAKITKVG